MWYLGLDSNQQPAPYGGVVLPLDYRGISLFSMYDSVFLPNAAVKPLPLGMGI